MKIILEYEDFLNEKIIAYEHGKLFFTDIEPNENWYSKSLNTEVYRLKHIFPANVHNANIDLRLSIYQVNTYVVYKDNAHQYQLIQFSPELQEEWITSKIGKLPVVGDEIKYKSSGGNPEDFSHSALKKDWKIERLGKQGSKITKVYFETRHGHVTLRAKLLELDDNRFIDIFYEPDTNEWFY